jgi:hypothetical protein
MNYTFETTDQLNHTDLAIAAEITAHGFGRENTETNYLDTEAHLTGMDHIQIARNGERLAAFAAFRRCLWQNNLACN